MSKQELIASNTVVCEECGSTGFDKFRDKGEIICSECGLVITGDTTKQEQESNYNKAPHVLISEKVPEKGVILHLKMLERWREIFRPSDQTQKNIAFGLSELTRIACELSLSIAVLETASKLYRFVIENRLTKGRSIRANCAAAIYAACRQLGSVRTLDDVARVSTVDKKEASHCYRLLIEKLDYPTPLPNLNQYASRLLNQLSIEGKTAEIVNKILKIVDESKIASGKQPEGIVSAVIYMASKLAGEKRTQREISEVSRVTEMTIRTRYKELERYLSFIRAL